MWVGFWLVEPPLPSPKSQAQLVGVFVDVSVNLTLRVAGVWSYVKLAAGTPAASGATVTVSVFDVDPPSFVVISLTV